MMKDTNYKADKPQHFILGTEYCLSIVDACIGLGYMIKSAGQNAESGRDQPYLSVEGVHSALCLGWCVGTLLLKDGRLLCAEHWYSSRKIGV